MKTPWSTAKYQQLEEALAEAQEQQGFTDTIVDHLRGVLDKTQKQLATAEQALIDYQEAAGPGGSIQADIERYKAEATHWRSEAERAYKARDNAKAGFARLKKKIERLEATP